MSEIKTTKPHRETWCPDASRYDRGECGWPSCGCPDNGPTGTEVGHGKSQTTRPLYQSIATLASNWTQSIADVAIEEGWEWKRTGDNIMWRKHVSGPINRDDGKWSATSV